MSNVKAVLDNLSEVFELTEEMLVDWNGAGNLQFPHLLKMMALKMNWNDKEVREADPLVRYYVRRHPEWHVTRGAHGGIMKISDKVKKDAEKKAREDAKAQMKAAIEAKALAKASEQLSNSQNDNDTLPDGEE